MNNFYKQLIFIILGVVIITTGVLIVMAEPDVSISTPPFEGLVGWWKFDENNTGSALNETLIDSSGQGNDGTGEGSASLVWVDGKIGKGALDFDGTDDYVDAGDDDSLNPSDAITISVWVNIRTHTDYKGIIGMGHAGGADAAYVLRLWDDPGEISFRVYNGVADNASVVASGLTLNTWQHIVAKYDKSAMYLYINGQETVGESYSKTMYDSSSNLMIGKNDYSSGRYVDGLIDDVRIYNYALTETQIKGLYQERAKIKISAPTTNGLVGYWKMDDNAANATVIDYSGQGNTGTFTDATGDPNTDAHTADGQVGRALDFDGTDDYISVSGMGNIGVSTVSFWVYEETTNNWDYFFDARADAGTGYLYWQNSDDSLYVSGGTVYVDGVVGSTLTTNTWHHVVVSGITLNMPTDIKFGTKNDLTATQFHDGLIDDVRIYNYALSAEQIQSIYISGKAKLKLSVQPPYDDNGLVGYWTFDGKDITGLYATATDISGEGNNGTINGGAVGVAGKVGQALDFDGSNDYVSIADDSIWDVGTGLTMSAWVKLDADPGHSGGLSYFVELSTIKAILRLASDKHNIYVGGTNCHSVTDADYNGGWHHVLGTYNGSNLKIYVDGTLENTCVETDSISSVGGVYLGAYSGNLTLLNTDGKIDDVRIYNRALSPEEVMSMYLGSK